jgi:DNA-binding NarL/FixJ family response regulator
VPDIVRRLLIVEDERLVAAMLADTLRRAGFAVEVAHTAVAAVDLADSFDPDGALIDVHLGAGPTGLHLGRRLSVSRPELRLIYLSRFGIPDVGSSEANALPPLSSFVSKEVIDDPAHLVAIIDEALRSADYRARVHADPTHPIRSLTETQLEVLRLAAAGLTNQAISERQGTVVRSVEQRLKRVYESLGITVGTEVNPRVEAIRQYIAAFGMPTPLTEDETRV